MGVFLLVYAQDVLWLFNLWNQTKAPGDTSIYFATMIDYGISTNKKGHSYFGIHTTTLQKEMNRGVYFLCLFPINTDHLMSWLPEARRILLQSQKSWLIKNAHSRNSIKLRDHVNIHRMLWHGPKASHSYIKLHAKCMAGEGFGPEWWWHISALSIKNSKTIVKF